MLYLKVGNRILKTGIAVTITMYTCNLLNLEPAVFGAISAVINMQPSIYSTLKAAKEQVIIHVLGILVGLIFGYLIGGSPFTMGLTTIFILILYTQLNLQSGLLIGIVSAIFILSSSPDQFLPHAFIRSAVIFIGFIIAMLVNIILWPPRYGHKFTEKLRESNEKAVKFFIQSVNDFVRLENEEIPFPKKLRDEALHLNKECQLLAERFRREKKYFGDNYDFIDPNEWFDVAKKLSIYNEALVEKADQIYELMPTRLERRIKHGTMPISEEFYLILDLLEGGCSTINRVNTKLRSVLCDKVLVEQEDISEKFWEKLTNAIEKWQPKLKDSYYLHAFIEVSVVAHEIRWIAREGKKLLRLASTI